MNRIYSISQDGILLIWKFIDEQSEEFKKHINFVKNIKSKKNYKYDKIYKKEKNEEEKEEEEEEEDNNNNIIGLKSDEEESGDESSKEEEKNETNIDTKYFSEFEKKILKGRFVLEKKEQFVINSKVVMCEISLNTLSEDDNILVLGLQNGSFSIYSLMISKINNSLKVSDAKISSISLNSSGKWIAFGSKYLNQLLVWEWKSESYIYKQQGHMNDINLIAFSPEGAQLASGAEDGRIKIFDLNFIELFNNFY